MMTTATAELRRDANDSTLKPYRLFTDWEPFKALRFTSQLVSFRERNNNLIKSRRSSEGKRLGSVSYNLSAEKRRERSSR